MITTERGTEYTQPRRVMAEGANVALTSCARCACVLVLDPADATAGIDVLRIHDEWHAALVGQLPRLPT